MWYITLSRNSRTVSAPVPVKFTNETKKPQVCSEGLRLGG